MTDFDSDGDKLPVSYEIYQRKWQFKPKLFFLVNYYIHNNMANAMREEAYQTKVGGKTLNTSLGHVIQFTLEFCAGKCEKKKR